MWDENFYEKAWDARLQQLKKIVESDPESDPLRAVEKLSLWNAKHSVKLLESGIEVKPIQKPENTPLPTFRSPYEKTYLCKGLEVVPSYSHPVDLMLEYLDDKEYSAIIELGSGIPANLIKLYYRGGPRGIPYYAGEYTESGCRSAQFLSTLDDKFKLKAFRFDFTKADFSPILERGKVFVFTCHSIEQVHQVPDEFFQRLVSYFESVDVFHFEPVGFQMKSSNSDMTHKIDAYQSHIFLERKWNMDLYPKLLAAQERGEVEILNTAKNVIHLQAFNPSSFIHWRAPRGQK